MPVHVRSMVIHFNDGTRKNRYWARSMSMYKTAGALGLKIDGRNYTYSAVSRVVVL